MPLIQNLKSKTGSQLRDSGSFALRFPPYVWWLLPTKTEFPDGITDL